jgi:hypothetical protein
MEETMIRLATTLLVGAALIATLTTSPRAEEYLYPGGWYEALYTKFKPICARRALEITHDHFLVVDMKAGRHVIAFDFRTGDWDQIVYFPVVFTEDGYEHALLKEWWETFAAQEGGKEQADAIFAEYLDCMVKSKREVGRLVGPPAK